jgi:protein phosphatase
VAESRVVRIPTTCVVVLIGVSGSGKSSFARLHFGPYEILSSDRCRAMITDDEADQSVTPEAFDLLRTILRLRLGVGRLSVIDATNVKAHARARTLEVAGSFRIPCVAVVLRIPPEVCLARNAVRKDRVVPDTAVLAQHQDLMGSLPGLKDEGFAQVHVLDPSEVDDLSVVRSLSRP